MGQNFDFEFRISNCEFGKQRAEDRRQKGLLLSVIREIGRYELL